MATTIINSMRVKPNAAQSEPCRLATRSVLRVNNDVEIMVRFSLRTELGDVGISTERQSEMTVRLP